MAQRSFFLGEISNDRIAWHLCCLEQNPKVSYLLLMLTQHLMPKNQTDGSTWISNVGLCVARQLPKLGIFATSHPLLNMFCLSPYSKLWVCLLNRNLPSSLGNISLLGTSSTSTAGTEKELRNLHTRPAARAGRMVQHAPAIRVGSLIKHDKNVMFFRFKGWFSDMCFFHKNP